MLFKLCPLQYYYTLSYPIEGINSADLAIGNFLHEFFYSILKGKNYDVEAEEIWNDIKSKYETMYGWELQNDFESFEEMKNYYSSIKDKIILWRGEEEYLKKLEIGMRNSIKIAENLKIDNYEIEKWESVNMGDFTIFGRFDIKADNEIIDLKSGNKDDNHIEQLKFYSTIYYLKNYIVPRAKVIYLQSGEIKDIRFTSKILEEMIRDIIEVANEIKEENFRAHMGEHCKFCPYRLLCES